MDHPRSIKEQRKLGSKTWFTLLERSLVSLWAGTPLNKGYPERELTFVF